ncbi:gamma-glutamyl-gamma-aminobutyrate hydrolase family protein [Patulibacter defluvii]|uniref:gamma-glutamyl-gamma-aminobutyrate hydrolase family protein n=2 Tax=Bacteria TaxID=2 RepID=UPI002A75F0DD|nr:gamma-glutamyl-gamma-aminobutyrate hydrolase family protein [Patulibacter sp. DM4]
MSAAPLIGLTTSLEPAAWGDWRMDAAVVPAPYVAAVLAAGGEPLLLPTGFGATPERALALLDGLLVVGGADVDPAAYGQPAAPWTDPRPDRDRAELALLRRALEADLPTLAICRGMQLLNVVRGGTLVQHLPQRLGHEGHLEQRGVFGTHEVEVDPRSRVGRVLGERATIRSYHHQGVDRIGRDLTATAWAADGTVEALEADDRRFAVGVLWHPEQEQEPVLIEELVHVAGGR